MACTAGEFFDINPGTYSPACRILPPKLRAHRCWTRGASAFDERRPLYLSEPALGPPIRACFVRAAALRYGAAAQLHPGSASAARFAAHRGACTTDEFFALHSGPVHTTHSGLAIDIRHGLCHVPDQPRCLLSVGIALSAGDGTFADGAPSEAFHRAVYLPASIVLNFRAHVYLSRDSPSLP